MTPHPVSAAVRAALLLLGILAWTSSAAVAATPGRPAGPAGRPQAVEPPDAQPEGPDLPERLDRPGRAGAAGAAAQASRTVYHNAEHGFSLTLPPGWVQIPDAEVRRTISLAGGGSGPNAPQYAAGFQRAGRPWFEYPYVLVQVIPHPGGRQPSESRMRREVTDGIAGAGNPSVQPGGFDASDQSFTLTLSQNVAPLGTISGWSRGRFGRRAAVTVHCYAVQREFQTHKPAFTALAGSLAFDPGSAYDATATSLPGWVRGALVGGSIGALVGFVVWLVKKSRGA